MYGDMRSSKMSMHNIVLPVNLKIVNFKKENRDCKKLLKQDENTGNLFYYIYYKIKILYKIPILTAVV